MELANAKIAVTGATGFLGRYIVRSLIERGAHVIAVVRNPDRVPAFRARGVELRKADLSDVDALSAGFEGTDAVVSNAALLAFGSETKETLIEANVTGVQNVFNAMRRAGVSRAVHTSSASIYRPQKKHVYTEDDPIKDADDKSNRFTHYSVSKACGEREAWRLAEAHKIALTVMRPSGIYGAFDENGFTDMFYKLMAWPITIYPTHMRIPNVYAGDVAEAMCLALENEVSIGRIYNMASQPGERSYWDHYRAFVEAGGKGSKLLLPIPVPIRYDYAIDRAEQELGWRNRPLVDGFRDMLEFERSWG